MPVQSWVQALVTQDAAGTQFNTYTTAKTVINQNCLYTFPANFFKLGTALRITIDMSVSNRVTGPDTTTFQVMLGTVAVFTTGAVNLTTTANTNLPARLVVTLTCQLENTGVGGAVAKFMGLGVLTGLMFNRSASQANSTNTDTTIMVPTTAPALGTAFDSTITQTLDFWVAQSVSNAGNGVRVDQYTVELLN